MDKTKGACVVCGIELPDSRYHFCNGGCLPQFHQVYEKLVAAFLKFNRANLKREALAIVRGHREDMQARCAGVSHQAGLELKAARMVAQYDPKKEIQFPLCEDCPIKGGNCAHGQMRGSQSCIDSRTLYYKGEKHGNEHA